jgi:aminoacylase
MRVPPSVPFAEIRKLLDEWTEEEGVTWEFAQEGGGNPLTEHHVTSIDREKNPWFALFYDTLAKRGVTLNPEVFPASTDARFVRAAKVPAFGFSPMRKTPMLLHDHNEFIGEEVFLEGIEVFEALVRALATAERFDTEL